jgi:hypothetical protein
VEWYPAFALPLLVATVLVAVAVDRFFSRRQIQPDSDRYRSFLDIESNTIESPIENSGFKIISALEAFRSRSGGKPLDRGFVIETGISTHGDENEHTLPPNGSFKNMPATILVSGARDSSPLRQGPNPDRRSADLDNGQRAELVPEAVPGIHPPRQRHDSESKPLTKQILDSYRKTRRDDDYGRSKVDRVPSPLKKRLVIEKKIPRATVTEDSTSRNWF